MARRTVKVKKYVDIIEEIQASGTIYPGHLLELDSDGYVKAHSAAGQNAFPYFALENELEGKGMSDAYSSGDKVQVWVACRGEIVDALLADGENVDEGDYLESNGDGKLKKHVADVESFESGEAGSITVYPNQIVGQAIEAVDISDSSGGESSAVYGTPGQRIKIRVI